MKTTIYVPDIECDSCVKVLNKRLGALSGVHALSFTPEGVVVDLNEHDKHASSLDAILQTITDAGFRASMTPFERKTYRERFRHMREKKGLYEKEYQLITNFISLFIILLGLFSISYLAFFRFQPDFLKDYGWWTFYLLVSIASLSAAVWHFYSYRGRVTCMVGMMVGMIFGMQTGMMIGAIFGATNGFFIGSVVGVVCGVLIGSITGNCCGIMGLLQGMMTGLMGGTMGAMITVMMLADHVLWFMPLYTIINLIIMFGLSYMVYEEVVEGKIHEKKNIDFLTLASIVVVVTFVLILIMLYAPQNPLIKVIT